MSSSASPGYPGNATNEGDDPRVPDTQHGDPEWSDDDEDDDDMNYMPASGDDIDEDDDEDGSYHGMYIPPLQFKSLGHLLIHPVPDAPEDFSGVEIEVEFTESEDQENEDDEDGEAASGAGDTDRHVYSEQLEICGLGCWKLMHYDTVTRNQIMQLLGHAGLGRIFAANLHRHHPFEDEDEEEDSSEPDTGYGDVAPKRRGRGRAAFQKVPSDKGRDLMNTGTFGSNDRALNSVKRKKKLAYRVMKRELGLGSDGHQRNTTRLMRQDLIPESAADTIIHYNSRCYSGQFSDDGNFFFSCAQDFRVRMYDTSNPYDWKYYKVCGYLSRESIL